MMYWLRCHQRHSLRALGLGLIAPLMAAQSQATRDSAGIQIVENRGAALPAARAWRIDPNPLMTIGGASADTDTLNELQLVMGITQLSDGRFAVGVQASHAVRFYDSRGRYLGFAGRKGEGPGEFGQIMGVRRIRGDTLFVTDLGEVELFSGAGKFAGQGASRARGDRFVYPSVVLSDGSYLGRLYDDFAQVPAGRRRLSLPVVRVSRDGARIDTIGSMSGPEQVFDGRQSFGASVVFSGGSVLAGDDRRFFVSSPGSTEISEFTIAGRRVRLVRLSDRTTRTSDEAIQAYRAHVRAMPGEDGRPMSPAMRARFDQFLERTVYAERLPPFGNMVVDRAGNLWAQHYDYRSEFRTPGPVRTQTMTVPSRWDVLDETGRWLCTVDLPARFTPVEIGTDYIAGLARDEDEVEQVRVYRLRKP